MESSSETLEVKSHESHEAHINKLLKDAKDQWLFPLRNKDSAAYMLTVEPMDLVEPFLKSKNSWLTIGDYIGVEANYLLSKNQEKVTASDISEAFLVEANKEGYVTDYSKVNVEKISFNDNAFDYTICKEAFHHFPRAYSGIYEMIRVSKKATILLSEPIDILAKMPLLLCLKNFTDMFSPDLINKLWKNRFSFEPVGNYVFKISEREIEKIAMGIGLPCVAFKGHNIFATHVPIAGLNDVPCNRNVYQKIKRKLRLRDFFSAIHLVPYNCLCSIIFKTMPDESTLEDLRKKGFSILKLPKNPYLSK